MWNSGVPLEVLQVRIRVLGRFRATTIREEGLEHLSVAGFQFVAANLWVCLLGVLVTPLAVDMEEEEQARAQEQQEVEEVQFFETAWMSSPQAVAAACRTIPGIRFHGVDSQESPTVPRVKHTMAA